MATEPGDDATPDMGGLLGMAMEMQQQLLAAQAAAAETVVEGQAGGGVVRIEVTGGGEFQSVTIDPAAVDPDDVEMLQDLVLAALNDAMANVADLVAAANPLAGLDLGGLLGTGGAGVLDVAESGAAEDDEADDESDGPGGSSAPA